MDSNRFTEMGPRSLAGRPPEEGWRQALSGAVSVDAATTLDVRFISSLPVMQGNVYKAWVDSKPVQMVWGVD